MPKFDDCESCAFYRCEPAICDECEDADQWEPDDEEDWEDMMKIRGYAGKVIRIRAWKEKRRAKKERELTQQPTPLRVYA